MIRGEKLKYYRESQNLTQKVLSEGICSISYLSKIENNSIEPTEEVLKLLSDRLKIDYEKLLQSSSTKELEQKIFNWYEAIKFRDHTLSTHLYFDLQKKVSGISDIELESQVNLVSARHHLLLNDYPKAKRYLEKVSPLIQYLPKKILNYYTYFSGLYEYLNGNLEKALNLYSSLKGNINEPEYSYQIGLVYTALNKNTMALVFIEKALNDFNKDILFFKVIDCYILLGINYNRINEYEIAESYLYKALKGQESLIDSHHLKMKIYHNLGCVYRNQNRFEQAVDCFSRSLKEVKNLSGREHTLYLLAHTFYLMDNPDDSIKTTEKALTLLGNKKNKTYYLLRILHYHLLNDTSSDDFLNLVLEQALPYFKDKNDVVNMKQCFKLLGHFYYQKRLYKTASDYFRDCIEIE
jgi:HTH-type transcriptional regulator, quorum sensing regulator NprR